MAKSRFGEHRGAWSDEDFIALMNKTRFRQKTRVKLRRWFVEGIPYNQIEGCSRQFIYKKLCELEYKDLI